LKICRIAGSFNFSSPLGPIYIWTSFAGKLKYYAVRSIASSCAAFNLRLTLPCSDTDFCFRFYFYS
jgi:hypothetical protein